MTRLIPIIATFFFAFPLLAQTPYEKGVELYRAQRYADALHFLDEAIVANPDWYPPVYLMGQCNFKLEKYKEALENFNDLLTLEVPAQEIVMVKYQIAKTYMGMKAYDRAIHAFTELEPEVPAGRKFDLFLNRAQCELSAARDAGSDKTKAKTFYEKGIASLSKALEQQTKNKDQRTEALYQKAFSQFQVAQLTGQTNLLDAGAKSCAALIGEVPDEKRGHELLITIGLHKIEAASDAQKVARCREVLPQMDAYLARWNDNDMKIKKGNTLQGAKDYKAAIKVFEELAKALPKRGDIYFSLASCRMADKQYSAAISDFDKALTNGQADNPNAYTFAAYCLVQQKNNCTNHDLPLYEKAVGYLERGAKKVSSPAVAKDLESKRANLVTLQSNQETDNQNHLTTIENVTSLRKSLAANTEVLIKNRERDSELSTDELRKAIEENTKAIAADEARLAEELALVKKYIGEAEKCGGAKNFPHYAALKKLETPKS